MPRRNPCRLYIHLAFTYYVGPSSVVWSKFGPAPPFPPMRVFEVYWSRALNLVCEMALSFCKFLTFDTQKLAHTKMHIIWHAQLRNWHVLWLVKENTTCQLTRQKMKWHVLVQHVALRSHFRRKCTYQLDIHFVFKNVMWHFGFEVECQMKFVEHTHCQPPLKSVYISYSCNKNTS